jgi:hypothetical protein
MAVAMLALHACTQYCFILNTLLTWNFYLKAEEVAGSGSDAGSGPGESEPEGEDLGAEDSEENFDEEYYEEEEKDAGRRKKKPRYTDFILD